MQPRSVSFFAMAIDGILDQDSIVNAAHLAAVALNKALIMAMPTQNGTRVTCDNWQSQARRVTPCYRLAVAGHFAPLS